MIDIGTIVTGSMGAMGLYGQHKAMKREEDAHKTVELKKDSLEWLKRFKSRFATKLIELGYDESYYNFLAGADTSAGLFQIELINPLDENDIIGNFMINSMQNYYDKTDKILEAFEKAKKKALGGSND